MNKALWQPPRGILLQPQVLITYTDAHSHTQCIHTHSLTVLLFSNARTFGEFHLDNTRLVEQAGPYL